MRARSLPREETAIGWELWVQGIIAVLIIVTPPDPVKVLLFNQIVDESGENRRVAALKVALYVLVILGVSALVGREILTLLGIDLDAFSVVGGAIIAAMGLEMLYGGEPSRAQGKSEYEAEKEEGAGDADGLLLPLSTPLLAGPGAITTVITISSFNDLFEPALIALTGVAITAIAAFLSMAYLGGALARLSERTTELLARLGGVLLATIGVQMVLGGLKNFFAA
jgi:multiple antibiotic resistance protein